MVMEPPSPQCVGREFVRQYYTLLNQAPLHLHRFYSHNSSFVHGGLENGKEAEAVFGQQDIHQKIMQLNFRDCHAKIRQVDSHETLANGVVVQVSGELSNNGEPMRRFMQTFVLAPQSPKKYYVHNDIFRYQDEVFDDPDTSTGTNTTEDQIREIKEMNAEVLKQQQPPVVVDTAKETVGVQHTNGSTSFEEPSNNAVMEVEEPVVEWKESSVISPEPTQQAWKSPEPAEPVEAVEEPEEVALPAGPAEPGDEAPASDAPRTWSSMVKSGAPGAVAASKPPAAPSREVKEGTPGPGTGPGGPGAGQAKPGYRPARGSSQGRQPAGGARRPGPEEAEQAKTSGDSQQLFVGNLPHNCSEDELVELFSKFGKVNDVRINQKQARQDAARGGRDGKQSFVPNFGFIVFADVESVEKALSAKPILLYGTHRLNVEEKKMRTPRDSTGPSGFSDRDRQDMGKRGSQDNLRGAGHPGRGGGDRGRAGGRGGGGRGRGDYGGLRTGGRGGGQERGGYRGGGRGG